MFFYGRRCKYFLWHDEPSNDYVMSMLNALKREVPHGYQHCQGMETKWFLVDEVEMDLKLFKVENDILKLKLQKAPKCRELLGCTNALPY